MKKALIAMSGGVDSSVAALLTKEAGYDCIGCTMKLYNNEDAGIKDSKTCCSLDDVEDARSVAYRLGMPYYVFNFSDDFREKVIRKFIDCYLDARTPNPCIDCNRYMKFDKLHHRAMELGCDKIVTGHYARVSFENGKYVLKKALDLSKDQSYVLYNLTQELLSHTLFPLGELSKAQTRQLAEEHGFINAEKPESQDICFVPDGDYAKVIREHLTGRDAHHDETSHPAGTSCPAGNTDCGQACNSSAHGFFSALTPGNFVSLRDGTVLGQHKGLIHYTVGQRKGLGISAPAPLYVVQLCPENNTVVLGSNEDLFTDTAYVTDLNWISGEAPKEEIRCKARIRYRQKEQPARIIPVFPEEIPDTIFSHKVKETNDVSCQTFSRSENRKLPGSDPNPSEKKVCIKLVFDEPQRAITPGQAAVFYDGDIVLGGGTIM